MNLPVTNSEVRNGVQDCFPRLWRYCRVLTGNSDAAYDLAQTVCVRAIQKEDQFEPGTTVDRWLFRIAQRTWLNELRSAAVRRGGGLVNVDDVDLASMAPDVETNIFAREVLNGVMALPEAQRMTVMLVYVEGLSYRDAAETLEIPIGTVMSRLAAARYKLSRQFKDGKERYG